MATTTQAEAQRNADKRAKRKSPMTPSQAARQPKRSRKRRPGQWYDKNSYCRAIVRACEVAFDVPAELRKIPPDIEDAEQERLKRLATKWRASKTGVPHVFPMTPEVQRHLDLVRELDSVFVLPIAKGSLRFVRTELKRLCQLVGVEPFGPQMVHRASVTDGAAPSKTPEP